MKGALAIAAAAALAACARSPERVEADQVRSAIERLRGSPADDEAARRKLVAELASKPAGMDEARRARDACAEAYGLLTDAKSLEKKAKAAAAPGSPTSGAEALGDLNAAEAKLAAATQAMPACDEASAALRRALSR